MALAGYISPDYGRCYNHEPDREAEERGDRNLPPVSATLPKL